MCCLTLPIPNSFFSSFLVFSLCVCVCMRARSHARVFFCETGFQSIALAGLELKILYPCLGCWNCRHELPYLPLFVFVYLFYSLPHFILFFILFVFYISLYLFIYLYIFFITHFIFWMIFVWSSYLHRSVFGDISDFCIVFNIYQGKSQATIGSSCLNIQTEDFRDLSEILRLYWIFVSPSTLSVRSSLKCGNPVALVTSAKC